jgi:transcriptional regulator with XRE-family HTH domain
MRAAIMEALSTNLRVLRARHGLTQEDVAAIVGAAQSTVGMWEKPGTKSAPDGVQIAVLAQRYGVTSDFLLGLSPVETGLPPDSWVVDQDYEQAVRRGDGSHLDPAFGGQGAFAIPRRPRIISSKQYEALEKELGPLLRKAARKQQP